MDLPSALKHRLHFVAFIPANTEKHANILEFKSDAPPTTGHCEVSALHILFKLAKDNKMLRSDTVALQKITFSSSTPLNIGNLHR